MAKCCIEGCTNDVRARGMCVVHYDRMRTGRDLTRPVRAVVRSGSDEDRFKSKILVDAKGCWNWTGSLTPIGYGQVRFRGRKELAHRASWMLFKGGIPKDSTAYGTMCVLHQCDNPRCINPEHLFLGDQKANAEDSIKKQRWGKRGCVGETHGRAIVTEADVINIRASKENGSVLAAQYGLSKAAIQHIRKRRSWKHI